TGATTDVVTTPPVSAPKRGSARLRIPQALSSSNTTTATPAPQTKAKNNTDLGAGSSRSTARINGKRMVTGTTAATTLMTKPVTPSIPAASPPASASIHR